MHLFGLYDGNLYTGSTPSLYTETALRIVALAGRLQCMYKVESGPNVIRPTRSQ